PAGEDIAAAIADQHIAERASGEMIVARAGAEFDALDVDDGSPVADVSGDRRVTEIQIEGAGLIRTINQGEVSALAAIECFGAAARPFAEPAEQLVVVIAAVETVVAEASVNQVVSNVAVQCIVAGSAIQRVDSIAPANEIVAQAAK